MRPWPVPRRLAALATYAFCLPGLIVTSSCAMVTVRPAKQGAEGVRFYPPYPYLLVSHAKEGGLQHSIVFLPKMNEPYVVSAHARMGSVQANVTLENGWNLTQFGATADSKTEELITALSGLVKSADTLAKRERPDQLGPAPGQLLPGLYAIEFDPNTGVATSLKRVYQEEAAALP